MSSHIWQILRICNEAKGDINLIATYAFWLLNLVKELIDLIIWRNWKEEWETLFFEEQRDFTSRIFSSLSRIYCFGLSYSRKEMSVVHSRIKILQRISKLNPIIFVIIKRPIHVTCTRLIIPARFIAREQDLHASFNYAIVIYKR